MKNKAKYVQCDACHKADYERIKEKTDHDNLISHGDERFFLPSWLIDMYNGVVCEMPICCILNYVDLLRAGIMPARTTAVYRNESFFNRRTPQAQYERLSEVEKEYVKSKRGEYVIPWL